MSLPSLTTLPPQEIATALRLHQNRQSEQAIALLRQHLAASPRSVEGWNALGCILAETSRTLEALEAFKHSLALAPAQPLAHFRFALQCRRVNDVKTALLHFNEAIKQKPDFLEVYLEMANMLLDQRQHILAEKILRVALGFHAFHPLLMSTLVTARKEQGATQDATELCQEAMIHNPDHGLLFCLLAELKAFTPSDPLVVRMEKLFRAHAVPTCDEATLAFTFAQIHDRADDIAAAFRYYEQAHRARSVREPYRESAVLREFASIREAFSEENKEPRNHRPSSPVPIFIVGMPRSGTSLVEQILASHPHVHGAGELPHLRVIAEANTFHLTGTTYPASLRQLDHAKPESYGMMAEVYLDQLRMASGKAPFVCDKMPHNFLHVGFIRKLFPDAKIIRCLRDPIDTCFSIFTSGFGGSHPYAHDLATLGRYYREYDALMQYWERLYPGLIHTVNYEALVEDFEPEVRALLEYCGLPWDAACLEFHTNDRIVQTHSIQQVRRPLYASSIGKWKRYAEFLKPLQEALAL